MEAILAQAPLTVTLEVIDQNAAAIALYRQLGFRTRRTFEVWTLTANLESIAAREVTAEPLGLADLPWQRADGSLPPDAVRLDIGEGAVILRVSGSTVSVLQLRAPNVDTAAALLKTARACGKALRFVKRSRGRRSKRGIGHTGGHSSTAAVRNAAQPRA